MKDPPRQQKGEGKGGEATMAFVVTDSKDVCLKRRCKDQACLDTKDHPHGTGITAPFADSSANDAVACTPCNNSWSPFSNNDDDE